MEGAVDFFLRRRVERPSIEVAVSVEMEGAVLQRARVHVREFLLHLVIGEHIDVRYSQRLEDVLLEVVV